jgi:hypothetical protein
MNNIKTLLSYSILVVLIISCSKTEVKNDAKTINHKGYPNDTSKYKQDEIKFSRDNNVGKKEGKRTLNEQIVIELYVPETSISVYRNRFNYYKEYFSGFAEDNDNNVTLSINYWDKKVSIDETTDDYNGKNLIKSGGMSGHKNFMGGITYNYSNKYYVESLGDITEKKMKNHFYEENVP